MAAPTDVYVNPALAANVGAGSAGNPYGDLQYALNSVTRDSTNGNRFLIKSGTDEVMTAPIDLSTYGTPASTAPLIFEGYSTTAGDANLNTGVGIAGISGGGSVAVYNNSGSKSHIVFKHLRMHNSGSADICTIGADVFVYGCQFDNSTGSGVVYSSANRSIVFGSYFTNLGAYGVNSPANAIVCTDCFFMNGTNDFVAAINGASNTGIIQRNIVWVDGSSNGIIYGGGMMVLQNSVLSNGGTGTGLKASSTSVAAWILNNVIEGFSGSGGIGINYNTPTRICHSMNNSYYNNETNYTSGNGKLLADLNNETLTATPFAKEGAISFANRMTYFAPVDVGSIFGGAYVGG